MRYIYISIVFALAGCLPEVPEIPPIPSGAVCSMDGFVLRPVVYNDDLTTLEFVLDETGEAMSCVFTYTEAT